MTYLYEKKARIAKKGIAYAETPCDKRITKRHRATDGVEKMEIIRYFDTAIDAKTYKEKTCCGGWIFEAENGTAALFPVRFTPSMIMMHHVTKGLSGKIVM
jgi:hypothetical protein